MQKNAVSIIFLTCGLVGQLWGMNEELVSIANLIEEADICAGEKKCQDRQASGIEIGKARLTRETLANLCARDEYREVKEYLESHDPIPADQYGISLKDYVSTARMAVLLEKRGISLDGHTKSGSLLHQACHIWCTPMLLQYAIKRYCVKEQKLDINGRRKSDGKTPLDVWVDDWLVCGKPVLLPDVQQKLQILLEGRANCTLSNSKGEMPLDLLEWERKIYEDQKREDHIKAYDALIGQLKQAIETYQ